MKYFKATRRILWEQDIPESYALTPVDKLTIYDLEVKQTGLIDEDGSPIMRSSDTVGFLR